jgi:pimeloyl-ACP methyl ester carboxylesterase
LLEPEAFPARIALMRNRRPVFLAIMAILLTAPLSACATREIPYADLTARYGLPASHRFEAQPGLSVHYTDEGNSAGRTLILVHGFAASVHAWRPWVELLKGEYRLIAIDLPGHGLTEAPKRYRATIEGNAALVTSLADHAGVARFVLVGNSMGGAVSITFAMANPNRLDGLVLVDSAGWQGEDGKKRSGPPGFVQLFNNPVGRGILKLFDPRLFARDGLKSAYLDETLVTDEVVDRYANLAMAPGHRDILLTQRSSPLEPATREGYRRIATPTLVLAGEQDKLIPVEDSRAIAAAIPGARLITYPEGGHVPMEQLPDRTASDLDAFLKALPPR